MLSWYYTLGLFTPYDVRKDLWSILLLVDISQPETHKLIYITLLENEILNMSDILVQRMLSYSTIRVGLFSVVLLWIIACHSLSLYLTQ